jgi:hypothetical protein
VTDVAVDIKVGQALSVGFGVVDNRNGWGQPNTIFCPIDRTASAFNVDPDLWSLMEREPNPNTSIAAMVTCGLANGLLLLDKDPAVTMQRQVNSLYAQMAQAPAMPPRAFSNIPWDAPPVPERGIPGVEFQEPEGLDLPEPPEGYSWALNLRGILFLEDHDHPGQPLWPWDVFDLAQMAVEAREEEDDEYRTEILLEIEKVKALFRYMQSVGDGIAMNARIFGDYYE